MLEPLGMLAETGVMMPLPGRDGIVRWRVCVVMIAMASFDHKEAMSMLCFKNAYKAMRTFCHMYVPLVYCCALKRNRGGCFKADQHDVL